MAHTLVLHQVDSLKVLAILTTINMEPWVTAYLDRIKYFGSTEPNPANLAEIHQAHMYAVPFEDLDIHLGIPLSLELNDLKQKVIENNRGGFCYELNYLFGNLLRELGYQVTFFIRTGHR